VVDIHSQKLKIRHQHNHQHSQTSNYESDVKQQQLQGLN